MTIQLLQEIVTICENKKCENYKYWETVYDNEIKEDRENDVGYVLCKYCKKKIIIK